MLEAMYGVEFTSNLGALGYGVVVLETGRVFGGDTSFVYIGDYLAENGRVKSTVRCTNDRGMLPSIFGGIREFTLELNGVPKHDEFVMSGHMIENPAMQIQVKFTRRGGCKNFCVNGHSVGNYRHFFRSRNDRIKSPPRRADRQPAVWI